MPQTHLYCEQQAHVLSTNVAEMKAFFGMQIVMGYHQLPSLQDWFPDSDLAVPFIANIMPRKRFEKLLGYVHFNNNAMIKPWEDPDHDRAFKVRLVLNHFNTRFLSALTATQHQSIDEYMVKLKGHNILRQFFKVSQFNRASRSGVDAIRRLAICLKQTYIVEKRRNLLSMV